MADARNFVIWLTECYMTAVEKNGKLKRGFLSFPFFSTSVM